METVNRPGFYGDPERFKLSWSLRLEVESWAQHERLLKVAQVLYFRLSAGRLCRLRFEADRQGGLAIAF